MRGPKRATKIRKLFNLTKEDDVRKYVNTYRRSFVSATGTVMVIDVGVVFCHASFRAVADVERGLLLGGALYWRPRVCFQARRGARHRRSRGLWLLWLCRGSAAEWQSRRRVSPKPRPRQQSTRSSWPFASRSSGSTVVRVWLRSVLHAHLLPSPRLRSTIKLLGGFGMQPVLNRVFNSSCSDFEVCSLLWMSRFALGVCRTIVARVTFSPLGFPDL